jgi:hypothetical protein
MDQQRWSHDDDVELVAEANPSRRRFGLLVVNLVVIAAAAVGGFYVLAIRDDPDAARPPETTVPSSSTSVPTVEDVLAIMPASPIDGKESQKLPVAALPQSDLVDGQVVNVLAKGFQPGERVGAVLCIAEAALEGVTACDLGTDGGFDHVTYSNASAEGFVQVDVPVRTAIVTPFSGPVDCLSGPERCLVAVGAVSDYDRSGGAAIGFVGQPAFPAPTFTVAAPGPYVPDQLVDVIAAGLQWLREVQVQLCAGEQCVALARGRVAADGTFAGSVALSWAFTLADATVVTCGDGCSIGVTYLALPDSTRAPLPATIPVEFTGVDPAAPPAPAPPPTTLSPPPSTIAATLILPPSEEPPVETPPANDATATSLAAG